MSCRFRGTLMPRSTASRCPALDLAVAAAAVRARPAPRATLTLRISTSTAAITYIYGCNTFRAARSTRDAACRKTMSSAFAGAAQWGGSNPIYCNPAHARDKPGTTASTTGWAYRDEIFRRPRNLGGTTTLHMCSVDFRALQCRKRSPPGCTLCPCPTLDALCCAGCVKGRDLDAGSALLRTGTGAPAVL